VSQACDQAGLCRGELTLAGYCGVENGNGLGDLLVFIVALDGGDRVDER
jgi:hypothetical protein